MKKKKKKITKENTASKTEGGLNLHMEEFCKAYTGTDRELFGNGTQCYIEVYGEEHFLKYKKQISYDVARALASRLLTKVNVINRINELLEAGGFNNENVDKQHLFLLNQHADLKTKLGAIREYNEVKGRIKKKIELTGSNGESLFNDEHRAKAKNAVSQYLTGRNIGKRG